MKKQQLLDSLEEWIIELKYKEYAEGTLKRYKANVLKFINWLDDDVEVTKANTIAYKDYLYNSKPQIKTSTINTNIIEINEFFKWLNADHLVLKLVNQQLKYSNDKDLTSMDFKRLLRTAKRIGDIKTYYIMKVLAMTGIRISELRYFTVENLKEENIIVYNKGKERTIIIRQDLKRDLRKYCRENSIKTGFIFQGKKRGTLIATITVWKHLKKIAGIARVKKELVHAHSFRHLFAQIFLEEYSGNLLELADLLGHNSLETTRLYTRTSNAKRKKNLEKLKF